VQWSSELLINKANETRPLQIPLQLLQGHDASFIASNNYNLYTGWDKNHEGVDNNHNIFNFNFLHNVTLLHQIIQVTTIYSLAELEFFPEHFPWRESDYLVPTLLFRLKYSPLAVQGLWVMIIYRFFQISPKEIINGC
jgi:hypothetical protein